MTDPEWAVPCPPQHPLPAHGAVVGAHPRGLGLSHTQASHAGDIEIGEDG
jgi:hypothetical protein